MNFYCKIDKLIKEVNLSLLRFYSSGYIFDSRLAMYVAWLLNNSVIFLHTSTNCNRSCYRGWSVSDRLSDMFLKIPLMSLLSHPSNTAFLWYWCTPSLLIRMVMETIQIGCNIFLDQALKLLSIHALTKISYAASIIVLRLKFVILNRPSCWPKWVSFDRP